MKLSELNEFAARNGLEEADIILQLEDGGCMGHTGVIKASIHVTGSQARLINLLPASALNRQPICCGFTAKKEQPKAKSALQGNKKITDEEIIKCMSKNDNNRTRTAKELGVVYKTISRRWKKIESVCTDACGGSNVCKDRRYDTTRDDCEECLIDAQGAMRNM